MESIQLFNDFSYWLDGYLSQSLPEGIVAFDFCLYEGGESKRSERSWHIQLIGASRFDKDDQDWACDSIYSTGEDVFLVPRTPNIEAWEDGLDFMIKLVNKYLTEGRYARILKNSEAVGIGFCDGDIHILFHNTSK